MRLLALTHLSTRYVPREIRDEARAVFPNTVVPRDFDAIEVPFPEKGEPDAGQGRAASPTRPPTSVDALPARPRTLLRSRASLNPVP